MHKNDKTFHIKSRLSYLPLLGFENAIMLGWEAQSTTFPMKKKRKKGKRRIARTKVWGESSDKMLGKTLCPFHEG